MFDRVLLHLQAQAQADARCDLDWDLHFGNATVVRAHQHAAGARRAGPEYRAMRKMQEQFGGEMSL